MKFTNAKSFIEWVEVQRRFSKKVSLEKMNYYLGLFNHPENKFKSIHITGTNGKGSTVAMLKAILRDKGLNVASFTSPYITCFNERIGYNDDYISDDDLVKFANKILDKYDLIENDGYELPTFFEFITILAFLYFSTIEKLDIVLVEVGMGGRLDSTNLITPILSIITNVSYDHMQVLGDTLEEILYNKLGIVKPNIPCVCGVKDYKLQKQVKDYCIKENSPIFFTNFDSIKIKSASTLGSCFSYKEYDDISLSLIGFHQIENASLVIESFDIIKKEFGLTKENLYNGLKKVFWQGRLEVISKKPYILVDGGHNLDGITRVCEFVKSLNYQKKRAVVSISHDKEIVDMVNLLDNAFDEIVFTKYTYARSADAKTLYNLSSNKNKVLIENINDALDYVFEHECDITIFIGSLYLASEIGKMIKKSL